MTRSDSWHRVWIAWCLLAAISGCGRSDPDRPTTSTDARTPAGRAALLEVSLPDLSRMDTSVQDQARERYAALTQKRADRAGSDAELGAAYGELGILLHAAEYYDAARPAYLNAQALEPGDIRWPYYLGHLYKTEGNAAASMASYKQALALRPDDVGALVWLGRMYLEQGQPENAEPLFAKAAAVSPKSVAALGGLGQTALARRDYARAAKVLEEALALHPGAASIHSPLAMAYRGLGDQARAESHLKQWKNTELPVDDPLMEALNISLQSGLSYELRGVRALEAQDWKGAADLFRTGVKLTPGNPTLGRSLRHKLGTALALGGDIAGAVREFEEIVQLAPRDGGDEPSAKAHYSLGLLKASAGRGDEAIAHFTEAVRYSSSYVQARMALADALRRAGRVEASLKAYRDLLAMSPQAADARLGYGMALVRLRRYVEARNWLAEAVRIHPERPDLALALARVLAAAPDDRARDGQQARAIVEQLFQSHKSTDVGETMAMTAAEIGDYRQAAAIQRDVIEAARRSGQERDVRRLTANLRLYERGQPCRTPWADDDPVHSPGPQSGGV